MWEGENKWGEIYTFITLKRVIRNFIRSITEAELGITLINDHMKQLPL